MRKNILFLTVLGLFLTTQVNAQVLIALVFGEALNTPKLSFGLNVGVSVSNITNLEDAKYRSSLSAGFFFDILLAENFYLHPEVRVKSTLGARNLPPYPTSDPGLDELFADNRVERRINYFNVPIMAKYRNAKGWAIQAGPEISLRHKARDEFSTGVGDKEDLVLNIDTRDRFTRFDFGVTGGLSKKLGRGIAGVTVEANYTYGLVDIDKVTEGTQRNHGFFIVASIPVGAGKVKKVAETNGAKEEE